MIYEEVTCPTCGDTVTTYARKFDSGMATTLSILYRVSVTAGPVGGWLRLPDDLPNIDQIQKVMKSRQYPKLRFWGFLEAKSGKKSAGVWRLTQNGIDAVESPHSRFPKVVYEKNSEVLFFSDGAVTPHGTAPEIVYTSFAEALEDHFDLDELMTEE